MKRAILSVTVLASALALAGCGGGGGTTTSSTVSTDSTTTDTTTQTTQAAPTRGLKIVVVGGVPEDGIVRKTVSKGDKVVISVTSDVADEVHVHGYDLKRNVAPGQPARVAFVAKLPGRFEIELEQRGIQIGDLTVEP